jgi:hypothetical protein
MFIEESKEEIEKVKTKSVLYFEDLWGLGPED